jgi:segregation and condensation protein B
MLTTTLESVLFAMAKPVPISSLKKSFDVSDELLREAIEDVKRRYNTDASGIHLIDHNDELQFVTNPVSADAVASFLKLETDAELTRPSLETLTIIAYRGPITKPEIEQIRGVNCSLILRNLLIRGLVEETEDASRLQPVYAVSTKFLRHLGVRDLAELPDYGELHGNERIGKLIEELNASTPDV